MSNASAAGSGDPMIALSNVHVRLGEGASAVHVLKGVSLDVPAGEALGLVGPSGSGKSTLLMVTAGLEMPHSGSVRIAAADIGTFDEDALATFRRGRIGIVFQSFHLIPNMTALENVAVPLELLGATDAFERAADELGRVGLGLRTGHYPAQLSGGEQQRVALARALVADPDILIADEPTGNLDGPTGEQIVELMFRAHRERGMTLVMVTHDADLAERCERVVHLRDGEIVGDAAGQKVAA
jgi:putative ABC transport system ATP-binding protein